MKRILNTLVAIAVALALQSVTSPSWADERSDHATHDIHVALDLSVAGQLRGGDYGV